MADTAQATSDDLTQLTKNPTPTLGDTVEEFEERQDDYQAMYGAGGHFKEQLEVIATNFKEVPHSAEASRGKEVHEVQEVATHPEVAPELEGYMEKVEKDPELMQQLTSDYVKTVGLQSAAPQKVKVKLPLTRDQVQAGLQHKVFDAMRWLAEWCLRQMKMVSLDRA